MKISKYIIIIFIALTLFFVAKGVNAATIQRAPNNLGLVGYWSFNEGTSTKATDFSGHGNAGTLSTTGSTLPQWTGGKLGMALSFDGSTNNVTLSGPTVSDTLTFTAWFKVTSYPDAWGTLIAQNNTLGIFVTNDNKISYYYGTADHKNTNSFNQGQWNHVAVVNEGGNAIFYINGVADGGCGSAPGFTVGYIGKDNNNNDDFNGLIDEVRVYNRALTATEVANLYKNSALTQINPSAQNKSLTGGLVGEWSFNGQDMDWANSMAYDRSPSASSGQGNNGTLQGANGLPKAAIGQVGQALQFDGVDDYVALPDDAFSGVSQGTFSAWFRTSVDTTDEYTLFSINTGVTNTNIWEIDIDYSQNPTGYQRIFIARKYNGAWVAPAYQIYGSTNLVSNTWYHVVATRDGSGNIAIYLNGVAETVNWRYGTQGNTMWMDIPSTQENNIGVEYYNGGYGQYFPGLIDEVRVYNRALSASEIKQLYNLGAARVKPDMPQTNLMKDSSLVGFWSFNGPDISNTANLAYDRSGQGNNGTMTNMATSTRYAIGKSGQALRFDGVDDYFETDLANNLMDSYQTGAVSAWVKTSVSGTGDFLAYANSTDVNSANSEWEVSNGVPAFEFQCSGWGRTYGSITVNDNKWHHIVFSADGTNPVKIYVDGVLDSTNYSGACGNNTYWVADILNIGSYNNYIDIGTLRRSTGLNDQFPGLIDEVRIYNRTLSAAEVMQLYRASGGR